MIIYLLGSVIAFIMLAQEYDKEYPNVCTYAETISIFAIGILASWLAVVFLLIYKYTKE